MAAGLAMAAPVFVSHFDQSSFDFYAQAVAPAAFAESG